MYTCFIFVCHPHHYNYTKEETGPHSWLPPSPLPPLNLRQIYTTVSLLSEWRGGVGVSFLQSVKNTGTKMQNGDKRRVFDTGVCTTVYMKVAFPELCIGLRQTFTIRKIVIASNLIVICSMVLQYLITVQ